MPSKRAVRTPVKPIRLIPSKQRSICLITIGRDQKKSPTGLHLSPGRAGEVYFSRQKPPQSLPMEVLWAVNQLQPGESVTIQPKQGSPNAFAQKSFTIAFPQQAVLSGPVDPTLYKGNLNKSYRWEYTVTLQGTNIPVPALDPVIIIEEDP